MRPRTRERSADVGADEAAHDVGYRDGHAAQDQLAQAGAEQRATGEPAHHQAAGQQGHRGDTEGGGEGIEAGQVGQQQDERPGGERYER